MNKNPLAVAIAGIVAVLVIVGGVVALTSNSKPKTETSAMDMNTSKSDQSKTDTTAPEATSSVAIQNFAFSPSSITVKVGTTVTWTNKDSIAHTVTSDDGVAGGPNSQLIDQNKTYSFTFTKAGTYTYHCTPHSYMKGTVTVTE
jgi:amicyanin